VVKRVLLAALLASSLARAQSPDGGAPASVESAPPAAGSAATPQAADAETPAPAATLKPTAPPAVEEPPPRPLAKKPIFWLAIVGGVAVVAAGITLAFVLNPAHDPTATRGVGVGN
jgi:hypothetical protein